MDDGALFEQAVAASAHAYAPYSCFPVGAAVVARDGRRFTGVNVENASYGLSLCAERGALSAAIAAGLGPGDLVALAVTASPCGACRQWLVELRVERVVFPSGGELVSRGPGELLPEAFRLES